MLSRKPFYDFQVNLEKAKITLKLMNSGKPKIEFRGKVEGIVHIFHYCGIIGHIRPKCLQKVYEWRKTNYVSLSPI